MTFIAMRQKRVVEYYCAHRSKARARVRCGGFGCVVGTTGSWYYLSKYNIIYYYGPTRVAIHCVRSRVIYCVQIVRGVTPTATASLLRQSVGSGSAAARRR